MHQKRATQNRDLFAAVEHETTDNSKALTESSASSNPRSADAPNRGILEKYIPLYRIELVRERMIPIKPRPSIHNPDDVVAILQEELLKADREKLVCVMLNAKNVVIGMDIVSVGTLTSSLASGREIFKSAILLNAAAIILSHCLCAAAHKLCYVLRRIMWITKYGGLVATYYRSIRFCLRHA
jgi:hypothetical protein